MTTAKERTGRGALPKSIEVVEAGPSVGWQGGPCADRPRGLEQIRVGWNRRRRSTDPVNLLCLFEVERIVVRWNRGGARAVRTEGGEEKGGRGGGVEGGGRGRGGSSRRLARWPLSRPAARPRADQGRMESPEAIHRPCESALPF